VPLKITAGGANLLFISTLQVSQDIMWSVYTEKVCSTTTLQIGQENS
jgi:hypothetical protein